MKSKMPNQGNKGHSERGHGHGSMRGNTGKSTGLRKENTQRADVLKKPTSKNPYPHGLA